MAFKTFANGFPLTATDLNTYLMKQTVMVFATASARAADLTSPTEGMVTYREDANILEVYNGTTWVDINDNTAAIPKSLLTTAGDTIYATGSSTPARLGIGGAGAILNSSGTAPQWLANGTNGQILTSTGSGLSWSNPSSNASMTLLSTTTLSGTSTTISSISQVYKNLYVEVESVNPTVQGYLRIAPNGSTTITDTAWSGSTSSSQTDDYMLVNGTLQLSAGVASIGGTSFTIYNYANTTTGKAWQSAFGGRTTTYGTAGGSIVTNSAISSLVFSSSGASASFSGGTVRIYGVN